MNSFTLTAIGNLAKDPEMMARGETLYTRFRLIGTDYGGKNGNGASREMVTSVQFVAFGALAEVIALNARKGDQLLVTAQMRANNWVDQDGEKQYGYTFVAQGFRFGAPGKVKREELAARGSDERQQEEMQLEPESESVEAVA